MSTSLTVVEAAARTSRITFRGIPLDHVITCSTYTSHCPHHHHFCYLYHCYCYMSRITPMANYTHLAAREGRAMKTAAIKVGHQLHDTKGQHRQ